jgi:hypothetical protein
MKNNHSVAWTHLPLYLSQKEIMQPFTFIHDLFKWEMDIMYGRKSLKTLFQSAINNNCSLSKREIVQLFGFKDYFIKLTEACYIIRANHAEEESDFCPIITDDENLMNPKHFCDPKITYLTEWECFPRYLTLKESNLMRALWQVLNPIQFFTDWNSYPLIIGKSYILFLKFRVF